MDFPAMSPNNSDSVKESNTRDPSNTFSSNENLVELEKQVLANMKKPNVPNVNVPEQIVLCLDVCYPFGDGSTLTLINTLKQILDFFIHLKNSINKKTEFALLLMKDKEACWVQNFTNNLKDILSSIEHLTPEESTSETFDFAHVFEVIKQNVEVPTNKQENTAIPPSHVVRLLVMYGRSNCLPIIPQEDEYVLFLKKQLYFYLDILFIHEKDCSLYKCVEIYDALQDLDNGYSYMYEVSRNVKFIHDCTAKLLAHPLQRPLQKDTDYSFGSMHGL